MSESNASTILDVAGEALVENKDKVTDFLSIALDQFLNVDIYAKVPFLGLFTSFVSITDGLARVKMARNIQGLLRVAAENPNPTALKRASDLVNGDVRFRDEIPDTLLLLLAESHKPIKLEMTGRMLIAVGEGALNVEDLNTMCLMVLHASIPALVALQEFGKISPNGVYVYRFAHHELLVSLGIVQTTHGSTTLTTLGHKMLVFGFGLPVPGQFISNFGETGGAAARG